MHQPACTASIGMPPEFQPIERGEVCMDPQDNKLVMLQKAINIHEQAASALADLMGGSEEGPYTPLLDRIRRNLSELEAEAASARPEQRV